MAAGVDSPEEAVAGADEPLGVDEGRPALVLALLVEGGLPWPGAGGTVAAPNDPVGKGVLRRGEQQATIRQ